MWVCECLTGVHLLVIELNLFVSLSIYFRDYKFLSLSLSLSLSLFLFIYIYIWSRRSKKFCIWVNVSSAWVKVHGATRNGGGTEWRVHIKWLYASLLPHLHPFAIICCWGGRNIQDMFLFFYVDGFHCPLGNSLSPWRGARGHNFRWPQVVQ